MCYDLGLQTDCSKAVAQGLMTPHVAENRKRIFWGCYMQDKYVMAGLCCSLAPLMPEIQIMERVLWPSIVLHGLGHLRQLIQCPYD